MRRCRIAAQTIRANRPCRADCPHFHAHRIASRPPTGYKSFSHIASLTHRIPAMSAKFYFYFFWHLRPLADREE
ncbi:hypothetical protein [Burkholderia pseudomallei]|uniref:hypothetical protein n=1 Tax=Burkholderia pseudomallei TaxID=28450 RepID=UPI00016AB846|nr:hypothetical protein [Burkholderia pseudomallei]EDS84337.1 hypothetical protein BURPSS13_A0088 [Burkholderia pseudomallei S13]EEH29742.1 hypothetical protein BUH_3394 [Burkholderia pseudomallei Pakistan 9]MBD2918990.1 hypothetical protein [Burkholderia pseudomallei]MBD2997394.1 hypothetical protein [Burkholderia pseudomallei]MBF3538047.1 hypothetical protein [Burkholderia pseudomallei]